MQTIRVLAFALIAGAACSQGRIDSNAGISNPAASGHSSVSCPSANFSQFLEAFASSSQVQKVFTAVPLQSDFIDAGAEPEPKTVTQRLALAQLSFPIIQTRQQQADEGLMLSSQNVNGEMVVTVVKPDTDYQVAYYFRQHAGCWQLYRKSDRSI